MMMIDRDYEDYTGRHETTTDGMENYGAMFMVSQVRVATERQQGRKSENKSLLFGKYLAIYDIILRSLALCTIFETALQSLP